MPNLRVGVYVDVENISRTGGRGVRFDTLRDFACRDNCTPIRLNAYLAFDENRAKADQEYRIKSVGFHSALRDVGFKVIEKKVRWFVNDDGKEVSKANSDLDLAVDMLLQAPKLDRILLVSGDGDFIQLVRAVQNIGCRVELSAFQNVSASLRCEADMFISGYLLPGIFRKATQNGEANKVCGVCYYFNHDKGFGFLRHLIGFDNLQNVDTREPNSNYKDAFIHHSQLSIDLLRLPSRDIVFEYSVKPGKEDKLEATDVRLVYNYNSI